MIEESYTTAKQLLKSCLDELKAGARLLLERETITPDDFPSLQRHEEEIASTVPRRRRLTGRPSLPATPLTGFGTMTCRMAPLFLEIDHDAALDITVVHPRKNAVDVLQRLAVFQPWHIAYNTRSNGRR